MAKPTSPPTATASAAEAGFAEFQDIVSRGQGRVQAMMETVSDEARRFFDGMTDDAATALAQFRTCQSPAEAFTIEQAWFARRAKAYMDCGFRLMQAATPPVATPASLATPSTGSKASEAA